MTVPLHDHDLTHLTKPMPQITRVELIGPDGRRTLCHISDVEISFQDQGRTLKIFYKETSCE